MYKVRKIVTPTDILDEEGNVVGTEDVIRYRIFDIDNATDEDGNPVRIIKSSETISRDIVQARRDKAALRRYYANQVLQKMDGLLELIDTAVEA